MLFNSFEFIFLFLPVTLIVFFLLGKRKKYIKQQIPILWLVLASLFFYGWWKPLNLPLIILSIVINYSLGHLLGNVLEKTTVKKAIIFFGIMFNLGLICYFKYANFFVRNVNQLFNTNFDLPSIIIPLAISFFTFQQIAYLVDAYNGQTKEYNILKYMLFVCFFPQLIAGPIVHHKEVLPQFEKSSIYQFDKQALAIGLTVFVAGLFKKVIFADRIAEYSNLAFAAASQGIDLTFSEAWVGALGYSLQLYFDFSGYSDMAVGAAYMFGIKLPLNFNSPYKAISIIDFWRRWHITLSHFLRDYLYIPLGGSRKGQLRRYTNLVITMLLGGLWHGAGWTFIFWGGLHGIYLVINHLYRSLRKSLGHNLKNDGGLLRGIGWLTTFIAVVISWVFFRANNFPTAISMLKSMFGFDGIQLPVFLEEYLGFLRNLGVGFLGFTVNVGISQKYATFGIVILLLIAWFTPNTQQWMGNYNPTLTEPVEQNSSEWSQKFWKSLAWKPNKIWTVIIAGLTSLSLLCFSRVSEFLYFQF
ncbi:MBOAT family protein [Waterburya agarophytonicola K14]|uniref:MBOAT family protein n=1 Tax=Waterburya agarophytonicola KI4 TaxID=2874699 RepID=A0A964FF37_9CYAN|nr:MBOAT family protein [Waterburya agarophytonicola]MCC0177340.1 MBOAT family protein [Waterburya agarophytonicola KI4]